MKPTEKRPWVRWRERRRQAVRRFAEALRPYHPLTLLESFHLRSLQVGQDIPTIHPSPGRALHHHNPLTISACVCGAGLC
jgi:hypothetical protein